MNCPRIAALLRELADELERGGAGDAAPDPDRAPVPPKKSEPRRRRGPVMPRPNQEPTELQRAKARENLRRRGIAIGGP